MVKRVWVELGRYTGLGFIKGHVCNCIRMLGAFSSAQIKRDYRFRKTKLSFEVCQNGTKTHKMLEKGFLRLKSPFCPPLYTHYQLPNRAKGLKP